VIVVIAICHRDCLISPPGSPCHDFLFKEKTSMKKPGSKTSFGKKPTREKTEKKSVYVDDGRPRLQQPRKEKIEQPLDNMRLGEMTIERMGHDGRGIAYWNQKTCFVEGALTGEKVTARLVANHPRYAEARVDQIIEASTDRIAAECKHYAECGGCQLQHAPAATQLAIKQAAVFEQLERWANAKPKKTLDAIVSPAYGYRRSARLAIDERGESFLLGFRQTNSHQLVNIDECAVLVPSLSQLIKPLHNLLANLSTKKAISHVDLLAADKTLIVFRQLESLSDQDYQQVSTFAKNHDCEICLQPNRSPELINLQQQAIDPRLFYSLEKFQLKIGFHPLDFIQVNAEVNEKMVAQALSLLDVKPDETVLDLFCGIGNFTLPIATQARRVIGIEGQECMVLRGRENAQRLGIENAEFFAADLEKMGVPRLRQLCGPLDAVLLDPPRDGAKTSVGLIAQLSPKRVVYVSCNPATLARDTKELLAAGYQLSALGVMDMFPQTAHVESMALFVRK
jgi:23S rRNA (uracil1939-C5)-methyltransferase